MITEISTEKIDGILVTLIDARVPAGFPSPAMDYMEEQIDLQKVLVPHPQATFYFRVTGYSMIDACLTDKSILIVDRSLTAQSGHIVVAHVNGGFTVKYI